MGFFSKKKKQQQHPSQQQQRDDTSSSASRVSPSPEPSLHSPSLRTQRLNSNTSSRFSNPFRSSSFSSPPPSPATSSNNNRHDPHHHRTPDQLFPTPSNVPPRDGHANLRVDTRQSRQESSWEDLGVRESASPTVYSQDADQREGSPVASLHRFKLFSGGGGSTVSLPLPQAARRESMEQETLREQHHLSHMAQQQQAHELEVEKKSRWKLGRGAAAKRRSGSVGSTLSMSQITGVGGLGIGGSQSGHGGDVEEDGGFFVRSFRTVSRVQDPISTGPYESLPPSSPPLPALPPPSPQSHPHRPSFDHDSHRSMAPPSSSSGRPARPPPTRSPGSGSWTNVADRAPSPTISVEAFRFASSRSKSTVSLVSMGDDAPLERPRFELRESRRGSFNSQSDVGVGALAPPRPQYARQHSRSTSNNSEGSSDGRGGQMNPSDSISSVASYSTAPERPHLSREASSETELKLIAMYGGSPQLTQGTLTPSNSTPFISTLPFESDSADLNVEHLHTAASTPARTEPTRRAAAQRDSTPTGSSAPSVAVQPPTPVPDPTFVPPPQRHAKLQQQSPTTARGRTVSAMAATTAKGKARGWNSDSSEQEDKEEEDSDDDSDDDDVPLANIRSRSQTDLSFYANHNASTPRMLRKGSSEVEVLAEPSRSPPKLAAAAPAPRESIGRGTPPLSASSAAALLRQGSQRRSVSTLSFSNPTHAPSVSLTTPPHPNLAYRSHSNPSSPAAAAHTLLPMSTSSSLLPSLTSSVSTTPTMSAASSFQPRIVSSSSSGSGSGSGSGSSAPRTPKDHSPAVSDLGMKSNGSTARSSVLGSGGSISILADDLDRRVKFADDNSSAISIGMNSKFGPSGRAAQRMSAQPLGGIAPGRSSAEPPRSSSIPNLHQSSLSSGGAPRGSVIGTGAGGGGGAGRPGSLASFAPGSRQQQRSPTTPTSASSTIGPSSATPRESGSVFDRMKQRHKAETLSAIALGKDLNGPEGAIDDDEDDEDDDEPLASLPARRGSQAGSMYAGSMMGGMGGPMQSQHQFGQQQWGGGHAHQSSFGGYSPLAMAPPGVDPYLYASLPNDQKMQLHQRSQQMMQMMAQAAYQAKAESQAGWDTGSNLSGASGSGGAGGNHSQRGSVASFGSFNGGGATNMGMPMMGMGMPMMGYGGGGGQMLPHPPQAQAPPSPSSAYSPSSYSTMPRGARLPPFAPSLAMSQSMFQAPMYAGSAIGGFGGGGGGGSMMGMPTSSPSASARGSRESLGGGKRASASALGTGRR